MMWRPKFQCLCAINALFASPHLSAYEWLSHRSIESLLNLKGRISVTNLVNPDFCALAKAYGAFATQVTNSDQFPQTFSTAVAAKKPALIHIKLDPQALTPSKTLNQIRDRA